MSAWTRDHSEEEWTAEALGERGLSDKKLRRAARDANQSVRVRAGEEGTEDAGAEA